MTHPTAVVSTLKTVTFRYRLGTNYNEWPALDLFFSIVKVNLTKYIDGARPDEVAVLVSNPDIKTVISIIG